MRLDLYYLGSALGADQKLNDHIEHLTSLAQHSSLKDRRFLLELLSHNYQLKGMIARDQIDYVTADACFTQASLVAQEAECPELHALSLARQATAELWRNRPDSAFYYCKRFAEGVCEDWVVGVGFGAERRKFTLCYFRGEKELFMDLSLRRILLIAGLVLILVAALLIWSITTARSAGPFQHTSYQSSHMVAFYCLPPPKGC